MKARFVVLSCVAHGLLFSPLFFNFDKTIEIAAPTSVATKPVPEVVQAVMVEEKVLHAEKLKLEKIQTEKRLQEEARQKKAVAQQKELAVKRQQEERLLQELKKKNEELQKEVALKKAEQQKLAQAKQLEQQAQAAQVASKTQQKQREDTVTQQALLMRNKIHQNWRQPIGLDLVGLICKLEVKLSTGGEVLDAKVVQSSGNTEFDRSTELAIRKASPLPMSSDPAVINVFRHFTFTFHPEAA